MNLSLLGGFLLRTIFWLVLCLAIWFPLGWLVTLPVNLLGSAVLPLVFPAWAEGVEQSGSVLSLLTHLQLPPQPGAPADRIALVQVDAHYLTYGYGLPLLMALFLASRPPHMLAKMMAGAVALLPFQAASVIFAWWKEIAISLGPTLADQVTMGDLGRNLIGLGYQFGALVLPTMVPVLLWLFLDRKLVTTLVMEAYLERAEPAPPPDDRRH